MKLGNLTFNYSVAQNLFEVLNVVVLKHFDGCTREPQSCYDGCVVELVREDQAVGSHQPWQVESVGGKPHATSDGVLGPQELSHRGLQLSVEGAPSHLCRAAAGGKAMAVNGLHGSLNTFAFSLSKAVHDGYVQRRQYLENCV